MSDIGQNNRRIAKNTLVLYARMLLLMIVSLYTSRVVLEALGVNDFGIYNVVGGFVGMLGFFTSSLTNVSQRYLNIGIGTGDRCLTIKYFKQCGTILFVFSILTLIIGETIGLWFVMNKLVIPPARLNAVVWVYQFSLISIFCSINQVNFLGAIVANEKMGFYAYLGLFEAFARLMIAFIIINSPCDHLILYASLTAFVSIVVLLLHIVYCKIKFDVCHFGFCWDKQLVRDMTKFISANLFGCFAWSAGVQGTNVILNLFFGPVVNAAKGISTQVGSIVNRFTENVMTAVKPQMIKSYASGDTEYMLRLLMKSSKLAFFISAIIAVPILIEADYILQIWLKGVPNYAVAFSRIVIVESLASVFINPLWIAANATGDIKKNQIYGRIFTLASLPLSYITLSIFHNPILAVLICALMQYLYWFYCIYDIKRQLALNVRLYFNSVIVPSVILFIILISIGIILKKACVASAFLEFLCLLSTLVCVGLFLSYVLMTKGERRVVLSLVFKNNKICVKKD